MGWIAAILACIASFSVGLTIGTSIAKSIITRIDWLFFRWDKDIFGFRPINKSTVIYPTDKIIMSIHLDITMVPGKGITLENFLNLNQIENGETP